MDIEGISTDIFEVLTKENHHNALKAEQRRQVESTETPQNIKTFAIWPHIQRSLKVILCYFFMYLLIYTCMGKLDSK